MSKDKLFSERIKEQTFENSFNDIKKYYGEIAYDYFLETRVYKIHINLKSLIDNYGYDNELEMIILRCILILL